jgi:hypothetical protein
MNEEAINRLKESLQQLEEEMSRTNRNWYSRIGRTHFDEAVAGTADENVTIRERIDEVSGEMRESRTPLIISGEATVNMGDTDSIVVDEFTLDTESINPTPDSEEQSRVESGETLIRLERAEPTPEAEPGSNEEPVTMDEAEARRIPVVIYDLPDSAFIINAERIEIRTEGEDGTELIMYNAPIQSFFNDTSHIIFVRESDGLRFIFTRNPWQQVENQPSRIPIRLSDVAQMVAEEMSSVGETSEGSTS